MRDGTIFWRQKMLAINSQGNQNSRIHEIPGIVIGFFVSQVIPEKSGNVMGVFHQALSIF